MFKLRFSSWTLAGSIILVGWTASPLKAQFPVLQDLNLQPPKLLNRNSNNQGVSGCVRLDGHCLFEITDQKVGLSRRIEDIEERLQDISSTYFNNENAQIEVYRTPKGQLPEGQLPNIYVSIGGREVRLMSVTYEDARLTGQTIENRADELVAQLEQNLIQAKQERQPEFITRRAGIAAGVAVGMLAASLAIARWEQGSKRSKDELASAEASPAQPVTAQLNQKEQWNIREIQHRLLQVSQAGIWGGGTLFMLGLFPQTRMIQILIIAGLRIPLRVGIVGFVGYFAVRLCYALIDRFATIIAKNSLVTPEANRRVQLRLSTISGVTKGIATVVLTGVGFLVALSVVGIEIGPLLAGAGILGVAVSLGSQGLIKDAINGFFIILEDQYAVGDVITVGDVGGLVESMNLRITQLRDAEGRLITIPNSEIKIVANLSNNWSRADLAIPIAYYADVDKALELITKIVEEMSHDELWRNKIVDKPEVLGVDDFGSRGVIIRVWIKTQPLQQWAVAREFRRRLKVALDKAGISIPMPQQEVWFTNSLPTNSSRDGQTASRSQ